MATRPEPPARTGTGGRTGEVGRERGFALITGGLLVAIGLAGSLGTPIVGGPEDTGLLVTGPGHDIAHLVAGALYLHVGLALDVRSRADGLVGLGVGILVLGLLSLASPDLLGLYGAPASGLDQVAHVGLGIASVAIGWLARGEIVRQERRGASRPRPPRRR